MHAAEQSIVTTTVLTVSRKPVPGGEIDRSGRYMARRLLRLAAVVALALCCCCCLIHAPMKTGAVADASSFPPGPGAGLEVVVQQDSRVAPPSSSCGAADQQAAVVAGGEAEVAGARMDLELEDYPGSGANDRHSPWAQQRRN